MNPYRQQAMEVRSKALAKDPTAKFIFYVTLQTWEDLHNEAGYPFDRDDPFARWTHFCGAKVVIANHTSYTYDLQLQDS